MNENQSKKITTVKGELVIRRRNQQGSEEIKNTPPQPIPEKIAQLTSKISFQCYRTGENRCAFEFEGKRPLPKLPIGYFFKGSAPREQLRRLLFPDRHPLKVRDFDLVRLSETPDTEDHRLSMKYMDEDYEHGRGVEVVESKDIYFQTRDLTMNEVLFQDRTLECTFRALEDLASGTIRTTEHVTYAKGEVQGRTYLKAIRLYSESTIRNYDTRLELNEAPQLVDFDIALHLERALSIGPEVAEEYLTVLWQRGLFLVSRKAPPTITDSVAYLSARIYQGINFFRHLPDEVVADLARRNISN